MALIETIEECSADKFVERKSNNLWLDAWNRLKRNRIAVFSMIIILLVVLIAILAPYITPFEFDKPDYLHMSEGSSAEHWLGTDHLGRDILTRIFYGARISLMVGVLTQLMGLAIGIMAGLMAGYFGGWLDMILSRIIDIMYAFPDLLFVILILTYIRGMLDQSTMAGSMINILDQGMGGLLGVMIGTALVGWLGVARLVRAQILSLRERDFVMAAQCIGTTSWRIMWAHLFPNVVPPIVISATLGIPGAMMYEASLSFLGLGVRPPMPSWGLMISEGLPNILSYPHLLIWPSAALSLVMLAFTFMGDGLRDALDPSMK
ncbi:MAG: ABC transporter permease [Anaerolineales bacterium]|nr:ABC transporter permease [Anaerolineales bacterium]